MCLSDREYPVILHASVETDKGLVGSHLIKSETTLFGGGSQASGRFLEFPDFFQRFQMRDHGMEEIVLRRLERFSEYSNGKIDGLAVPYLIFRPEAAQDWNFHYHVEIGLLVDHCV